MKRILLILVLAVAVLSLAACGSSKTETPAATSPPVVKGVSISIEDVAKMYVGATIVQVTLDIPVDVYEKMLEDSYTHLIPGLDIKGIIYADTLNEGILMLRSGKADILHVMHFTGTYLGQRNNDLNIYIDESFISSTHMLFSPERQEEFDEVNAAIKAMNADGTMKKLIDQWITNLPVGKEPSGQKMPVYEGAKTIKVGISGDEPPLDYMAADGKPGGFNIAMLSEISNRTRINIELVSVTGGARFMALESGKIDSFLWHLAPKENQGTAIPFNNKLEIGAYQVLLTDNYLDATVDMITLKK